MLIGERLRAIREAKKMSQGDVEHRTGLLRAYISRVENGHTVPAVETLEKFARALEVPMYQLFYEGSEAPKPLLRLRQLRLKRALWGDAGKEARQVEQFRRLLSKMEDRRRGLLLSLAQRLAQRRGTG
jgi:transcriptional regulator with XRE-family HTH domain